MRLVVWCGDMYICIHTYTYTRNKENKENKENQEVKEELFILLEIIINTERNMCGIDGGEVVFMRYFCSGAKSRTCSCIGGWFLAR